MTCGRSFSQLRARSRRITSSRSWLARSRASCSESRLQAWSCGTGIVVLRQGSLLLLLLPFCLGMLAALLLLAQPLRLRSLKALSFESRKFHALLFLLSPLRRFTVPPAGARSRLPAPPLLLLAHLGSSAIGFLVFDLPFAGECIWREPQSGITSNESLNSAGSLKSLIFSQACWSC